MNHYNRRDCLRLGVASALLPTLAWAQGHYPDRPIKMIVPFAVGGAVDILARVLASGLSTELKQPVVVENRTGATGHIGGEAAARATPDGYTVLLTASSAQAVSLHLLKLGYKPLEDLTPVALLATLPNVVVVHKDVPARTLAEFIAYAKANPGKVSYGSYGPGSNLHLAGEMLANKAGLDLVHVPYNSSQLITDLLAGRIQLLIGNITEVEQHIKSGSVRALAITSPKRSPDFPELPAVAEVVPGYGVVSWGMLLVPARTPPEIVTQLNAACLKVLEKLEVREAFAKVRFTPTKYDVAQSREFMLSEAVRWEKVIQEAKVPMLN